MPRPLRDRRRQKGEQHSGLGGAWSVFRGYRACLGFAATSKTENLTRQNAGGLESAEARLNQRIDEIERLLKEDVALGVSCIYSMILNLGKRLGISEDDLLK